MRYRVKDYSAVGHVITLPGTQLESVEDIRLIVNETQKSVLCSSMQKDRVLSVVSAKGETVITLANNTRSIANSDNLTIEIDKGDSLSGMGAEEVEAYYNEQLNA